MGDNLKDEPEMKKKQEENICVMTKKALDQAIRSVFTDKRNTTQKKDSSGS